MVINKINMDLNFIKYVTLCHLFLWPFEMFFFPLQRTGIFASIYIYIYIYIYMSIKVLLPQMIVIFKLCCNELCDHFHTGIDTIIFYWAKPS